MDYNGLRKAANDAINALARFQQELDRNEAADTVAATIMGTAATSTDNMIATQNGETISTESDQTANAVVNDPSKATAKPVSGANENVVNPALGVIPASVVSKGVADDYEATSGKKGSK